MQLMTLQSRPVTDLVAIMVETLKIDSECSLEIIH